MPFVKEERYMSFVSESDVHADKTDLAIQTLSDDVSKLRAEIKILESKLEEKNTPPSPPPSKAKSKPRTAKAKS
jgi:chaperonin cofactor prefoldin